MRPQHDIEQSIRSDLPIAFGKRGSVEDSIFGNKYVALVASAKAISEPFLSSETVRYQSILLFGALFLISIGFFRFGDIKLFDKVITVDAKVKLVYTLFVISVGAIFSIKAYIDTLRAVFIRSTSDLTVVEMQALLSIGLMKKRIQEYFWLETFDLIGQAYGSYYNAQMRAIGKPEDFKHTPVNALTIDVLRSVSELAAEIVDQEHKLELTRTALADDEADFIAAANVVSSRAEQIRQNPDPIKRLLDNSYQEIEALYATHLKAWIDARNVLVDEHFDLKMNEVGGSLDLQRAEGMLGVLKRLRNIRRIYVALEIVTPLLFGAAAVFYCWR